MKISLNNPSKWTIKRFRYIIASAVASLCSVFPVMGWSGILPSAQTKQNVSLKGNVPVVNIVAPNARGVSHNKYDKFNVGRKGVILNNNASKKTKAKLLSEVEVNPNLK